METYISIRQWNVIYNQSTLYHQHPSTTIIHQQWLPRAPAPSARDLPTSHIHQVRLYKSFLNPISIIRVHHRRKWPSCDKAPCGNRIEWTNHGKSDGLYCGAMVICYVTTTRNPNIYWTPSIARLSPTSYVSHGVHLKRGETESTSKLHVDLGNCSVDLTMFDLNGFWNSRKCQIVPFLCKYPPSMLREEWVWACLWLKFMELMHWYLSLSLRPYIIGETWALYMSCP